jgi:hypothetical protein
MPETQALLKRLLEALALTHESELDCDQVFAALDLYAEAIARGEDPAVVLPLVRQHLEQCPDCSEEQQALLAILTSGVSDLGA